MTSKNAAMGPAAPHPAGAALADALRTGAARASELGGGGAALVFARTPENDSPNQRPTLRAAAGVDSPGAAQELAERLAPCLDAVIGAWQPDASNPVHDRDAGAWIAPLAWGEHFYGALVLSGASAPGADVQAMLDALTTGLAQRLDHARCETRLAALESQLANQNEVSEEKNEELLKLSEALFAQDIELLQKDERLGKVEKLKNDFIEKMSRELRTPLNSIIEAIISVLAGENENLSDSGKDSLRRALDDGSAFLRTLQNILDLWRIKQGELPVELQEVNFREVVEEAIFSVQDTLGDKPVVIEKQIEEPLPKLRTDLAKTNQILFLLLENAVKFTRRGSIRIQVRVDADRLECSLVDTGIGICPDDRQFIFDEFFQVDDDAEQGYRGSGLGLALVRDLLILLDGEIEMQSEVGQGSTFRFRIPVQTIT